MSTRLHHKEFQYCSETGCDAVCSLPTNLQFGSCTNCSHLADWFTMLHALAHETKSMVLNTVSWMRVVHCACSPLFLIVAASFCDCLLHRLLLPPQQQLLARSCTHHAVKVQICGLALRNQHEIADVQQPSHFCYAESEMTSKVASGDSV